MLSGPVPAIGAVTALAVLLGLMACVAWTDIRRMIIPDAVNGAILLSGFAAAFGLGIVDPLPALVAAVVVLLLLMALRFLFRRVRGYDGLGLGDVKFVGASVGWTGAEGLPVALFTASVAALAYLLGRRLLDRGFDPRARLPFGPFLAFGVGLVGALQIATGRPWSELLALSIG